MNIQTAIVLTVIAVAAVIAIRVRRRSGGCHCDGCSGCQMKENCCGQCGEKNVSLQDNSKE